MVSLKSRVAVIGGGIAGVSAAYALVQSEEDLDVVLCEAERQLAHHTTGRSAAMLVVNYGAESIRPLTVAGVDFLTDAVGEAPVLSPRNVMTVARPDQMDAVERHLAEAERSGGELETLNPADAQRCFPALRAEQLACGLLERGGQDIDVALLHQVFVQGMRSGGARIETLARVDAVTRSQTGQPWTVETTSGSFSADFVVNAAGAWGDLVAQRAGVQPVGLVPKRRTAFMVPGVVGHDRYGSDSAGWPFVLDIGAQYYIKPDGEQFLCSPADETPSDPVDAKPEELDIAIAIDRINEATTLDIRTVRSSWAGLRTFAPDGSMVIGPDPETPDFVWCVGQGGTGIQTARAAGQLTADLMASGQPGTFFDGVTVDVAALSPARLRR